MISNQQSDKGVVKEKTQVDGDLFKTKRGWGPRLLLMPKWLRKKRQLLSTATSANTSDSSKFVEVYLCDNCDKDFDSLQDLTTHEAGCGMKEVPKSPTPLVFFSLYTRFINFFRWSAWGQGQHHSKLFLEAASSSAPKRGIISLQGS